MALEEYYLYSKYNWNVWENWVLLLFVVAIVMVLLFKVTISPKGYFNEEAWSRDQSKNIQAGAAMLIVLHHMTQSITDYGKWYKGPITEMNSLGILFTSIFFFFSGFGLYKNYKTKESYLDGFLKNRLPQVVIPFMVTNLIYFVTMSGGRVNSLLDGATSALGITLINTNAWFLVEIIILYLAFYFIFSRVNNEGKALSLLSIFTLAMVIFSLLLGHDNSYVNGHYFMGEWWYNTTCLFIVGMLVARNEIKIKSLIQGNYRKCLYASLILFSIFYIVEEYVEENFGYYQEWKNHPGYESKLLTLLVQTLLCLSFIAIMLIINQKCNFNNRVIKFLGGISLEIYLIHDIFRQRIYNPEIMPDWEFFILVYLFTIISAKLLEMANKFIIDFWKEVMYRDKSEELSYEARKRLNVKRNIIKGFAIFYIIAAALSLILGANKIYKDKILSKKICQEEREALSKASIGDEVFLGQCYLDYSSGKEERIPWIVIDEADGHLLLVSKYILWGSFYNRKHIDVDWKQSTLCKYLNYNFYDEAFSDSERELLTGHFDESLGTWIENEYDAFVRNKGNIDVKRELVFILNEEEASSLFTSDENRIACASKAASDSGLGTKGKDRKCGWWLSSKGEKELSAMYVDYTGAIIRDGKTINNGGLGVRPAVWVSR